MRQKRISNMRVCLHFPMATLESGEVMRKEQRREGMKAGIETGIETGIQTGRRTEIFLSVQDGDYSVNRGAEKLGMSVDEFEKSMSEAGYRVPELV